MNECFCLCSKFKWQHFAHKPIKFSINVNSHSQNIIFIFTLICILLGMMHPITLVHRVLSPAINSIAHILFMSIYLIECLLYNTFHVQFFTVSCHAHTVQMPSLSLLFLHFYGHKLKYKELHKFQWVFYWLMSMAFKKKLKSEWRTIEILFNWMHAKECITKDELNCR